MSIAETRQRMAQEELKRQQEASKPNPLVNALVAGGLGYLTGGLGNLLLAPAAGVGAAFAPSVGTLGTALTTGAKAAGSDTTPEKAAAFGVESGLSSTMDKWKVMEGKKQAAETAAKLGLPAKSVNAKGEIVYERPTTKTTASPKGRIFTEAQARTRLNDLYKQDPDIGGNSAVTVIDDARAKGKSNLWIYNTLRSKGYLE